MVDSNLTTSFSIVMSVSVSLVSIITCISLMKLGKIAIATAITISAQDTLYWCMDDGHNMMPLP